MPYDAPMSLEEALMDEEARRRALAYLGAPEAPLAPVPDGAGTGNQPSAPADAGMEEVSEPAGTTGADLVQRYLAAQGADARQARLNSLGEGFGNAASTILGAAGVPYARSRSDAPRSARDVLDLERVKAAGERPSGGRAAKPPGMTDAQAQAAVRASYPEAPEDLVTNTTASSFDNVMKDLRAKYGTRSREELAKETAAARAQEHKDRLRIAAEKLGVEERKLEAAFEMLGMRLEDSAADRAARTSAAATKREQALAERNVGGFEFDTANPPSADASKQMAQVSIQSEALGGSLNNLEALYKESGTEITGEISGTMGAEWKNITDQLRMISNMGVPNGRDYEMLALQLENPAEVKSLLTSKARGLAQMATVRKQIERLVAATAKAYKFRSAGGASSPQAKAAPTKAQPRRKRDKEGRLWEEQPDGSARLVR